jgi:ABC-2 type transport system ATP-binding protein
MVAIVRAEGVVKRWGSTEALKGASFEIGSGVTGLLGANGAGKTTLLGLILGMHRPDGGRLEVLGRDPWTLGPEVRARVGYAPEHDCLPEDVRAHDIVRHFAEVHGLPKAEAQTRASDALWEVGLGEERFRAVGTMSTGQRQRVKLALAIAYDPEVVLLDEPTNGLDPVQRDEMLALIRKVGHELGIDVILSSHLLEEVERVSDSVVIVSDGMIARSGSLDDLRGVADAELLIRVDGPGDAPAILADAIGRKGTKARVDGTTGLVVVTLDDDAVYDLVRDTVADLGLGLRRLERRRATLEEVYLEADTAHV